MYKIFADGTLVYDSTLEDYAIGKGEVTLELDAAGSFVFSLFPDHPYYDSFVKLKTVVTVYKSGRIVFRGRILDESVDYWNTKTFTCEGELNFLQDSIVRPFNFSGTPAQLFRQFVEQHNAQVDSFKQFQVGTITVEDPNGYIARSNSGYESALSNMRSRLLEDATGGHFYITHGDDGTDPTPTIHYLADFTKVATQPIEFGANLRDYGKTITAEETATAVIPLGAAVDDGDDETEDQKLTITGVNDGCDYVYSAAGVAQYGWIFKVVEWDDVTNAANLKAKAEKYLESLINQAITLELTAVDLHLLDRTIESYNVCEYVHVVSAPHKFSDVLLCNKQTMDLLNPANDTVTMGATFTSFTAMSARSASRFNYTLDAVRKSTKETDRKLTIVTDYLANNPLAGGSSATIGTVYLPAANWAGSGNLYSQVVTIAGVTENSQVDLTPSMEQLAVFYDKSLALVAENEGGVVTVYAIGQRPENDYTIQVTITEVRV